MNTARARTRINRDLLNLAVIAAAALILAVCTQVFGEDSGGGVLDVKPKLRELIEPAGITTLVLVAAAVALGFLRRAKKLNTRTVLGVHKAVGVCALVAGCIHATIVFIVF